MEQKNVSLLFNNISERLAYYGIGDDSYVYTERPNIAGRHCMVSIAPTTTEMWEGAEFWRCQTCDGFHLGTEPTTKIFYSMGDMLVCDYSCEEYSGNAIFTAGSKFTINRRMCITCGNESNPNCSPKYELPQSKGYIVIAYCSEKCNKASQLTPMRLCECGEKVEIACVKCKEVFYCSIKCQEKASPEHGKVCFNKSVLGNEDIVRAAGLDPTDYCITETIPVATLHCKLACSAVMNPAQRTWFCKICGVRHTDDKARLTWVFSYKELLICDVVCDGTSNTVKKDRLADFYKILGSACCVRCGAKAIINHLYNSGQIGMINYMYCSKMCQLLIRESQKKVGRAVTRCFNCHYAIAIMKCSVCKIACYCSEKCRKKDEQEHSEECCTL